ncbi:MAG: tetratricopeptide repeat protein [Methanomicrobiales archaeon]|nr:tetratricopeptide repeat protein [Methanomicrobiales archaeon]
MELLRILITLWLVVSTSLLIAQVCSADNFDAINYYNQGVDLANEGNFSGSLAMLDLALIENGNFTLAFVARAGVLSEMGRCQDAVLSADRAISLNTEMATAWNSRSQALNCLGRFQEAKDAAEAAIRADAALPEAWVNLGTAEGGLGRYGEEVNASLKALALSPGHPLALSNLEYAKEHMAGSIPVTETRTRPAAAVPWTYWGLAALVVVGLAYGRSRNSI